MNPEDISHQEMVRILKKNGEAILAALTPEDCDLFHMGMGVAGEGGELLDAVKKAVVYRIPINIENVIEELGDLEFFMEGVRQNLNITREETLEANKRKLHKRYENYEYTDQRAKDRADKCCDGGVCKPA